MLAHKQNHTFASSSSRTAPYMYDSLARSLEGAPVALSVIQGGGSGASCSSAHSCRYRPTARDVARDQRLRMRTTCVVCVLICLLGVLAAARITEVPTFGASAIATQNVVSYQQVCVSEGDSLWSLAADHPVWGMSTKQVVELLITENDLQGSIIHPGQVLNVPADVCAFAAV